MKRMQRSPLPLMISAAGLIAATFAMAPPARAASNGPHELQIRLSPTGVTPTASGKAKFKFVRRFSRLTVEAHGLLPGSYDILIGGGAIGTMDVSAEEPASRFDFDSRTASGLLFDPRGTSLEIVNRETRVAELQADEFPSDKTEEIRKIEIATDFANAGVQPAASGDAEFKSFRGRSQLRVSVAGLAPGTYDVLVGGAAQARIAVTSLDTVDIAFDSLPSAGVDDQGGESLAGDRAKKRAAGSLLLTFDPRGLPVSLSQGGATILLIDPFPEN